MKKNQSGVYTEEMMRMDQLVKQESNDSTPFEKLNEENILDAQIDEDLMMELDQGQADDFLMDEQANELIKPEMINKK